MTARGNNDKKSSTIVVPVHRNYFDSLIAGALAGLMCTITCSPFDVAKVRVQVQGSLGKIKYHGSFFSISKLIYKEEGYKGFFKGIGPALCTVPLFWAIYWSSYDTFKEKLEVHLPHNPHLKNTLAAIGAGATGDVLTNPLWVIRTRIQAQALHIDISNQNNSAFSIIRKIYLEEGVLAFYRGLGASFLGLIHVAIQFPLYEYLKTVAREQRQQEELVPIDVICASIFSKLVASSISYPHEVLRARLQDQRCKQSDAYGVLALARRIVRDEGMLALWTGIRINIFRMIPATISTFVSYEYINRWLLNKHKDKNTHVHKYC